MTGMVRAVGVVALVCAAVSGCGQEAAPPADTTSTQYMFDNLFNPCRQMPESFLIGHGLTKDPEGLTSPVEKYAAIGCSFSGPTIDLTVQVSNAPLNELGRESPNSFAPTEIAQRRARILSLPLERRFCRLDVEIAGGILALGASGDPAGEPCTPLTALAEELVPQLPDGV
ncbi:hypothetical protein ATM97_18880 [Nocardia sp. MH4]|uniref:DUF3558 family protein n=1 Tax=Nocardia sp. MH4 TaxID=1768677 RepID=UPI001C4FC3BD|nr:DUF3558 family protein [Nocardia sp. MH4]MBW0272279.1 hypothetical protein [Nocardia sp. MH4]